MGSIESKKKKSKKNKIIVYFLGDHSVGKSTILSEYANDPINQLKPNKNIEIFQKKIELKRKHSIIKIYLELWDISGDLVIANFLKKIKDTKSIFIFVYDVTNKDSFNNLIKWKELISDFSQNAMIAIIGNKNDLTEQKVVSTEEGKNFAEKIDALFFEISSKKGYGEIDRIFKIIIENLYGDFREGLVDFEEDEMNSSFDLRPNKKEKNKNESCCPTGGFYDQLLEEKILYKYTEPLKKNENFEEKEDENETKIKQIIKYTNGDVYEGECIDNLREGLGIIKYNNGNIYKGEWRKDQREGKGVFELISGEICDGEWKEGKLLKGKIKAHNMSISIEDGEIQKEMIKVLFIGDTSVGKSTIIKIITENERKYNYLKDKIELNNENEEDNNNDFFYFDNNKELINLDIVSLEIVELNGNEINNINIFKNAKIIILVYDITEKNSFDSLNLYYKKIQEIENENEIIYGVIGNKTDLKHKKQVSVEEGINFSKSLNANFIQTNRKNGDNFLIFFQNILTDYYMSKDEGLLIYREYSYYGQLNKMKKIGLGIMINNNYSGIDVIYSGNWKNDLKKGFGIMINLEKDSFLEGEWENDSFQGKMYSDIIYFEGYINSITHNCDLISGNMQLFLFEGMMLFYNKNTNDIIGMVKMNNGNLIEKNESRYGNCTIKYNNGNTFYGKLDNDFKREGEGIVVYNNNDIFIGEWESDNLTNNKGILIYKNGDLYKGEFNINIFNKEEYTLTDEDTEKYNISEKLKFIEEYFPNDINTINFLSKYDEEIIKKELDKSDIYEIWNLGMEYKNSFLKKKKEIDSLKEKSKELSILSTYNEKIELIKEIEILFNFTNKLRKYIIFSNKSLNNILINDEDIKNLDKNFIHFNQISFFKGLINDDGIDFKCKEGKGIMKYNNGDLYEGEWKNDKKEGNGIMKFENGNIYEGEWKNDLIEGKGIMKCKNGEQYEGEWANNKREGHGKMKYINGEEYEGEWKNDLKDGKGILKYKNEEILEGYWKEDEFIENNKNEAKLDFNLKKCQIKGHEKNLIVGYCIDDDCSNLNKLYVLIAFLNCIINIR